MILIYNTQMYNKRIKCARYKLKDLPDQSVHRCFASGDVVPVPLDPFNFSPLVRIRIRIRKQELTENHSNMDPDLFDPFHFAALIQIRIKIKWIHIHVPIELLSKICPVIDDLLISYVQNFNNRSFL